MNYSAIRTCDVANGPGVRVSLFVSGCTHCCPGCFNPDTWDLQFDWSIVIFIFSALGLLIVMILEKIENDKIVKNEEG